MGKIGVDIFFTISGFLITSILLEQKESVQNKLIIIKHFIIKRALRLFPVYYLLIFFFFFLQSVFHLYAWNPGEAIYYFTYTQNFLFYLKGMRGVQLNHTWSLAIEEQFYLVWPWLVIYIPHKYFYKTLVVSLVVLIFIKYFMLYQERLNAVNFLTIFKFDTLGGGALTALLLKEKKETLLLFIDKIKLALIIISMGIIVLETFFTISQIVYSMSLLVLSISLVVGCYYNFAGIFGKILDNRKLMNLGSISYGLYLYHKPIPYFMNLIMRTFSISINSMILLLFSLLLTFVISYLSYNLIEKRFLTFKEKFDL